MSLPLTPPGRDAQSINIENDGSGNPLYVGWARPGTANSDKFWLVARITYSGGFPVTVRFAGGGLRYEFAWDDRASLSYS